MLRLNLASGPSCLMLAAVLAFNAGCATSPDDRPKCDLENPKEQIFKLKIQTKVAPDGNIEPTGVNHADGKSANLLHTCPGDIVLWGLKDHDFVIAFDKGTASPFSWGTGDASKIGTKNWLLQGLIEDKEPKDTELKYSIQIVGGGKYDPIIIVER